MDQLYKRIVAFQHKCNDYIDDHAHAAARSLKNEIQRLEDEAQVRKHPRSLEDRVKQVIKQLEHAGSHGVMSPGHVNELVRVSENFREELRSMS
jgi:hypothetical protein